MFARNAKRYRESGTLSAGTNESRFSLTRRLLCFTSTCPHKSRELVAISIDRIWQGNRGCLACEILYSFQTSTFMLCMCVHVYACASMRAHSYFIQRYIWYVPSILPLCSRVTLDFNNTRHIFYVHFLGFFGWTGMSNNKFLSFVKKLFSTRSFRLIPSVNNIAPSALA